MTRRIELPLPVLDALPLGAHRINALTDEALFRESGVRVAFFGRGGGTSTGCYASLNCWSHIDDDPLAVQRNLALACEAVGAANATPLVPLQVHGTNIVTVDEATRIGDADALAKQGADGLLVGQHDAVAILNSADCPIVVVVSPTGRFAVVHAGWRGAVAGIAGKAVRALSSADECPPSCFNAYISPHIRSECFQVGEEVSSQFLERFGERCVPDVRHVSLVQAITRDLVASGMDERRIADSGICTKCNPEMYFSYRATEGKCGRNATAVVCLRDAQ